MPLLWHIVLKDLRRLRLPLAIWSALQLLAQIGPDITWSLTSLSAEQIRFALYLFTGAHLLSWLAAFDFAIRLIHEDSHLRTDAFWRTRPISGLRLLAANLAGLALFTLLSATPALLTAALRSSLSTAAAMLELTLETHLVIAACAVPFATLTRSFRQCLFVSLGVILLTAVIFAGVHITFDPAATDLYVPRMTLITGIALITACTVVIHQFLRGRLSRSLRITTIGTLAIVAIAALWPFRFPLIVPPLPNRADEPAGSRDFTLAYEKSQLWNEAEFGGPSLRPVFTLDCSSSRLPQGYFLRQKSIHHHWLSEAAPSVRGLGGGFFPNPDAREILGLLSPRPFPKSLWIQSQIPEEFAALLRSRQPPPHYRADLVFDLHKAEVIEIFLHPGQTTPTPHFDIRVLDLDPRAARLRLAEYIRHLPAIIPPTSAQFILYNSRTRQALRATGSETVSFTSLIQRDLIFAPMWDQGVVGPSEPLTDDFLRDARLVIINFPRIGTFSRTLEIPDLKPHISR